LGDFVVFETDIVFFVEVLLGWVILLLAEGDHFVVVLGFAEEGFFIDDGLYTVHFIIELSVLIGIIVVSDDGELFFEGDFDVVLDFCSVVISLVIRVLSFFKAVFSDLYVSAVVFRLL
jgi:hypothetical protein